jgi:hypothetical protein
VRHPPRVVRPLRRTGGAASAGLALVVAAAADVLLGLAEVDAARVLLERGGGDYDEGAKLSARGIMQKRIAEPTEIANLITFLLSDEASFCTAGLFVADGGETEC